ncbi:ferritin-like metal-binding protein YciE [Rhizomicrobium palustre]|uniref:Ferritin-like metal-binding protein YciE n=1 Tax=Rhizomicrobium palustre TaxID=189966 RepID=A0A846N2X8_9PROT|nr:DUF892 family protein [Rhizomicrobium palustre]NIK89869.1 ferritin-like metal-binding protein YciE [Rhizomicrobium palustre]
MPSPKSAEDVLATELKEIYSAEKQLARALPRLAKKISNVRLKECLDMRVEQGARLMEEIDEALEEFETSKSKPKNVAAEGLIKDAEEHATEIEEERFLEPVLAASVQKLEHYCIAAWGTAKSLAELLGKDQIVETMERTLDEGREMDENITQLVEEELNPAMQEDGEEDEEDDEDDENEPESMEEEEEKPRRHRTAR